MQPGIDLRQLKEPLRMAVLPPYSFALNGLHIVDLFNTSSRHGRSSLCTARK